MYDINLLKQEMIRKGFNDYRLGLASGIDEKTVKAFINGTTEAPRAETVYWVSKALGFPVRRRRLHKTFSYDFTAILRKTA